MLPTTATPPVPSLLSPPCPRWCRHEVGHGLTTVAGHVKRLHLSRAMPVPGVGDVELEQHELVRPDGSVESSAPTVCVGARRVLLCDVLAAVPAAHAAVA